MTGSSVVLAYFLASLLAVPAALSIAELSTAMPRAGGIYYLLDRSLGPGWEPSADWAPGSYSSSRAPSLSWEWGRT
jgi:amino acid transporter